MKTVQQWREAANAVTVPGYGSLVRPGALADLADRLHLLAEDSSLGGVRRMLEHLRHHGVPEDDWGRFVALHPAAASRNSATLTQVIARQMDDHRALTELGLARRVADQHGADLAWCKALGGWASWDGRRWRTGDGDHRAQGFAVSTVDSLAREVAEADALVKAAPDEATAESAEKHAKAVRAFARDAQKARTIGNALTLARSEGLTVDAEQFDARPELLTVANGTVELGKIATLREHQRADRLTRVARADYDAGACSAEWDAFVKHVIPDDEARAYAQKAAGYSLFGRNNRRLMFFMMGPTSSGKSTFVEVIGSVLGDHASTFNLSLFAAKESDAARPDIVDALPTRFLHTSEASDRWKLSADSIKRLIGDETQSARGMRSDQFLKRRPAFTPWIATNEPPTINGADLALWRRLVVIPCGKSIEQSKEDVTLAHRLGVEQREAVLAWLVEGWNRYQADGLEPPSAIAVATMKLRESLSAVDVWLSEAVDQDAEYTAAVDDLWDSFSEWCTANGFQPEERGNKIGFGKKLSGKGFGTGFAGTKDKRHRVRTGLRLRAGSMEFTDD